MKTLLITLGLLSTLLIVTTKTTFADTNCVGLYGGGQTCTTSTNISINKTVLNPSTNIYVDNLGVNDPKYTPGQTVPFQIAVTNTGNNTLNNVTVQDVFPQYVNFVSGNGTFDANTKTLTFTIDSLTAGQTQTFTVKGQIVTASQIPGNNGITCVVNQSIASDNGAQAQDNAQFCIQQPVLGVTSAPLPIYPAPKLKTTPPTGPETTTLLGLLFTGLSGMFLRRKTR